MSDRFQTFSRESEGGDPQREADSGHQVRVNRRRDDFLAGLPVQESESVQTGPGMGEYRSLRICGRELILLSYSFAPKMVVHTVPKRDWAVLLMSLEPQADVVYNGVVARPGDLFLCMGHDGYMTAGKNRRTIAIGVPKARLVSACAALAGSGMSAWC